MQLTINNSFRYRAKFLDIEGFEIRLKKSEFLNNAVHGVANDDGSPDLLNNCEKLGMVSQEVKKPKRSDGFLRRGSNMDKAWRVVRDTRGMEESRRLRETSNPPIINKDPVNLSGNMIRGACLLDQVKKQPEYLRSSSPMEYKQLLNSSMCAGHWEMAPDFSWGFLTELKSPSTIQGNVLLTLTRELQSAL